MFGGDGVGFDDLIDMVNPLHHIPIVGQAYRAVTGDTISTGAAMIGGGIFGGIAGVISSGVGALVDGINGESISTSVAQIVTQKETKTAFFAPEAGTKLQADEGQALLALYEDGAFQTPKPQPKEISASTLTKLSAYAIHKQDDAARLDPLNLDKGEKTKHLQADLHKTMLDTLS